MSKLDIILSLAALIGVVATLFGIMAVWVVTRRPRRLANDFTPPITILKPLKGRDEDLEANLRSFFLLDYPIYQLIFGVASPDDPAVDVVRKLLAEFPGHDTRLVVGAPAFGLNPKVENLAAMDVHRTHEFLLISDSNVRVRPLYLRETAAYLAEPGVGLVSNLFAGVEERQLGAVLENLQINGFVAAGVAGAAILRATCVVGKSMLLPARVLAEVGGLAGVRNLLAEDQALAYRVRKAGYRLRLSHHVIENVNRDRGLRWFLNRHSRWFKIRRRMAPLVFLIEPLSSIGMIGILCMLTTEGAVAWVVGPSLVALSSLRDALQSYRLRHSFPRLRHVVLSPVKDLFLLPVWFDAVLNNRVNWRGSRLVIGRLTRLHRTSPDRDVRLRVKRLQRLRERNRPRGDD